MRWSTFYMIKTVILTYESIEIMEKPDILTATNDEQHVSRTARLTKKGM